MSKRGFVDNSNLKNEFLEIEVRNIYLKNQHLIHFEMEYDYSKWRLDFKYNIEFAEKYNLPYSMWLKYDEPVLTLEHNNKSFSNSAPFGINIIHDIENNKIYID